MQTNSIAESAPAGLDWNYVYNYKGGSAVSVGRGWLLTAKHVAEGGGDGTVTNGPGYQQQEIKYHPNADLALVRFDKAFPGSYALYTGDISAITNEVVLMVGYGTTGTVNNDYWTNDDGNSAGTKRWGSQRIDRPSIKRYDFTENYGFLMEFNLTNTTHEAGGGVGDSGGGVFYNGKLAGINTSVSSALVGGERRYSGTFACRMPYYADWIAAETIPEPAAIGLMGFGTIGLFLARSKRRRKLAGGSLVPIRGDESICDRFDAVEGSENPKGRGYADYLAGMLEMIRTSPLSLWMNALHTRYNALNKAIWRLIIATVERSAIRKEAAAERVNQVVVKSLDVFLEKVSWGRIVTSARSGRAKATRALRMGTLRSLDVVLDKISWDQMVSLFSRRK